MSRPSKADQPVTNRHSFPGFNFLANCGRRPGDKNHSRWSEEPHQNSISIVSPPLALSLNFIYLIKNPKARFSSMPECVIPQTSVNFKYTRILLVILLCCGGLHAQTKKEASIASIQHQRFEKLLTAGETYRFVQGCSAESNSVLHGTLYLPDAELNNVKRCNLVLTILNDTVYNFKMITRDKSNTLALTNDVKAHYGAASDSAQTGTEIYYVWYGPVSSSRTHVTKLTLTKTGEKGLLDSYFK